MYFSSDDDSRDGTVVVVGPLTAVAVTAGIAATVMLGVFPAPFLDWAGAILAAP
jgi:NADH-quinone oxidoreductase subunit N